LAHPGNVLLILCSNKIALMERKQALISFN
jgi:hypothetical protein